MHPVQVCLINPAGLRLTLIVNAPFRSVGHENAARDEAERVAAADSFHAKHGPWTARSSAFLI